MTDASDRPRVVIVGAGFGGLAAVRHLAKAPVRITVVDRNNYHSFLPLVYQVAAAELETTDIAYPVRSILRRKRGVEFILAEVQGVDLDKKVLLTGGAPIPYDFLILAPGSAPNTFGVPGAEEHAFPLTSVLHAVNLRNQILRCFEEAVHEPDPGRRQAALTFVVVGGGATGVEFAGALIELIRGPLAKDYRTLDVREMRVILLEAMDALLPALPDKLRAYTAAHLKKRGVDLRLKTPVAQVAPGAVTLKDGTVIPTHTVVWTAGVQGDPRFKASGLPATPNGRVAVLPTLQVPGHPEAYVIGDLAYVPHDGGAVPMVASGAVQEATVACANILRHIRGQELQPFRYKSPGIMVTIGRNAGVASLPLRVIPRTLTFTGFFAWFIWLAVHLFLLIGFRNRILVMINWAWDYFFFERAVRLIVPCRDERF
ncbi:MAG: NAD(P)/FAD-dependent oxidoreductase [Anaerolineae bacterium]|nr:NAD(P)/FAD-dependent oxidoreductase [Anaerolineae bacterium]